MIKTLLTLPFGLSAIVEGRKALSLSIPAQHGGIQFQSIPSLRVVLRLQM